MSAREFSSGCMPHITHTQCCAAFVARRSLLHAQFGAKNLGTHTHTHSRKQLIHSYMPSCSLSFTLTGYACPVRLRAAKCSSSDCGGYCRFCRRRRRRLAAKNAKWRVSCPKKQQQQQRAEQRRRWRRNNYNNYNSGNTSSSNSSKNNINRSTFTAWHNSFLPTNFILHACPLLLLRFSSATNEGQCNSVVQC